MRCFGPTHGYVDSLRFLVASRRLIQSGIVTQVAKIAIHNMVSNVQYISLGILKGFRETGNLNRHVCKGISQSNASLFAI